ncbi:TIGR00096: putative S-adenosylmethionine-dependent methyltransferase, YraL family [Rubrobacter radiotolerans]|uniref:Ribosomal RNA small subunit methyltransferase I n=1 Tax=Rubrobacter radiotolerans TaxID=42256 RepID=A0A023X264_RUBRA|nr:16S rRNA (cytidine(1402)-2'-O)-methyltransferase [Rubrobacter radiotolerans]AHY46065.1 TIGR00096: putative S-adenosylmethionine-dependent methyltransferase, YraL family [Rubrobacter radiotolerans]MDX5893475.1 16S rRNA (cytidine(1402)-2'-O)-methyltransferase [Rubrobacter radiotolerans]SMC03802.1 16S rRNA (cytidine1402-2'-O)-methyltransferase [Rubrobacter radiotolerans DSM 5868]
MTLTVVPTPIGNLEDITLRALRVLREADVVACEDTRRTGRLLEHYGIEARLLAYHDYNEDRLATSLAERAREERVALVTDAGTPLVSDPGYAVVRACIEAGVPVEVLPGASAVVVALAASGLPPEPFTFYGFVPKKRKEREALLLSVTSRSETAVLFESPRRLARTLLELPGDLPVAVCRELTKLHEEVFRGTAAEAAERFSGEVRGEVVLVVRGGGQGEEATFEEALTRARSYVEEGEKASRAAARAAAETGFGKGRIYDALARPEG